MIELSKPVAYDYQMADACIADGNNENGKWVDWNNKLSRYCPPDWMVEDGKVTELKPLYSQEYVSALTQRIAELEEQKEGWVDIAKAVGLKHDELKAKLATPVRLPDIRFINVGETPVAVMHAISVKEQIRRAGFKVEGDE